MWHRKTLPAHSDKFKQRLSIKIISVHTSIMMLKQLWICVCSSSPKSRNTTSESHVRYSAILEFLLMLSEFNLQYINRSVCEFYIPLIILRISIRKAHHEKNQENGFQKKRDVWERIRIQFGRRLYPWNLTLNAMKQIPRSHFIDFMKFWNSHKQNFKSLSNIT